MLGAKLTCLLALLIISCTAARASVEWLEALLAQEPTVGSGLAKVLGTELVGEGENVAQATVELQYLDVTGEPKTGKARLFVPQGAGADGSRAPLMVFAHYECDPGGALHWCRRGWAVATTHENGEHCLGNSFNLDLALIEWVRRLPFVDRTHLAIAGGSAGGYMALAMTAEAFPVAGTSADVPVLNWAYNGGYLLRNGPLATAGLGDPPDLTQSPLPVVAVVLPIGQGAQQLFGNAPDAPAWRALSPVCYLDRITGPVSLTFSTADMLVPMPQLSLEHVRPPDPALFPGGFEMSLEACTADPAMRTPLLDLLPQAKRAVFAMPIGDEYYELTAENVLDPENHPLPPAPPGIDRPFDPQKQWSIVIHDEGAPLPHVGHLRHHLAQGPESFMEHIRQAPLPVDLLTLPKLGRLMERTQGALPDSPPLMGEGVDGARPVHRLNFVALEQLDVVTGLLDYADCSAEHAARLQSLYGELPLAAKAFGDALQLDALRARRDELLSRAREVVR